MTDEQYPTPEQENNEASNEASADDVSNDELRFVPPELRDTGEMEVIADTQDDAIDITSEPEVDDTLAEHDTLPNDEDEYDVEGALAAVASLEELAIDADDTADDEEESLAERVGVDDHDITDADDYFELGLKQDDIPQTLPLDERFEGEFDDVNTFPRPKPSAMQRGTLASIIPAILLIGVGGLLTLLLTTSDDTLSGGLLLTLAVGGFGVMLIGHWLSSGRWAVGSFFIGIVLLLLSGTAYYLVQPTNLSLLEGYPLFLTAIGLAFVLTDIFNKTSQQRVWLIGLLVGITGLLGVVVTSNLINASILNRLQPLLPVALVIVAILLIAPVLRRNRPTRDNA